MFKFKFYNIATDIYIYIYIYVSLYAYTVHLKLHFFINCLRLKTMQLIDCRKLTIQLID